MHISVKTDSDGSIVREVVTAPLPPLATLRDVATLCAAVVQVS